MNNYGESIQVHAEACWNIAVGEYRRIGISHASMGMIKDTAIALSKANPSERVIVSSGGHIRWIFESGESTMRLSEEDAVNRCCPYKSSRYRERWATGQAFPIEAWVDVRKDGKKFIIW